MMQTNLVKKEVEIAVPSKYLSNFRRTLDVPLINCEVSNATNATFQITDTELYVPVVTLSAKNDKRLLQ